MKSSTPFSFLHSDITDFAHARARRGDAGALPLSLLAPLATAVAHVAGEVLQSIVNEGRACRPVVAAAASPVACPPTGGWSFPGNHAATVGAAAVALAFARPRTAWFTVPPTLLMAFSRVFVSGCAIRTMWR
nr:hypothetical protein OG781_23180 [Streptomyces sp. NBC_00830]